LSCERARRTWRRYLGCGRDRARWGLDDGSLRRGGSSRIRLRRDRVRHGDRELRVILGSVNPDEQQCYDCGCRDRNQVSIIQFHSKSCLISERVSPLIGRAYFLRRIAPFARDCNPALSMAVLVFLSVALVSCPGLLQRNSARTVVPPVAPDDVPRIHRHVVLARVASLEERICNPQRR
jgi:hypothetical protein